MVISGIIPIRKGARVALTDSTNYRSIAISSLLRKIDRQVYPLSTLDYQFGFKSHSFTVLCTTMAKETFQYYSSNGAKPAYFLLDASKAFDKVSFYTLLNMLIDNKMCPHTVIGNANRVIY